MPVKEKVNLLIDFLDVNITAESGELKTNLYIRDNKTVFRNKLIQRNDPDDHLIAG